MRRFGIEGLGLGLALGLGACAESAETDEEADRARAERSATERPEARPDGEASTADEALEGPRLKIDPRRLDFGDVVAGELVEREVELRNVGTEKVIIKGVRVGCGCIEASAEPRELDVGETGRLRVRFRSDGGVGDTEKFLRVLSNDPRVARKHHSLRFEVSVVRLVELAPSQMDFGKVLHGDGAQQVVELSSTDGRPFRIQSVECLDPHLQWSFEQRDETSARLTATLARTAPLGWPQQRPLSAFVQMEHEVHERLKLPVIGDVVHAVKFGRSVLDFGVFDPAQGTALEFEIENLRPQQPVARPELRVDCRANDLLPDLERGGRRQFVIPELEDLEPGIRWKVRVTIEPEFPLRTLSGRLGVEVGGGELRWIPLVGQPRS